MTTYAALLRGINLGSRAKIGMADLKRLFLALGHANVETYLRSGNVVFRTADADPARLAADLEHRIAQDLGVSPTVLLRTAADLERLVAGNPFLGRESDSGKLHVTFLSDVPDPGRVSSVEVPGDVPDEFSLVGADVYLHCPNGYGRTKLSNAYLERRLGVAATTRNWKTVQKLHELTGG